MSQQHELLDGLRAFDAPFLRRAMVPREFPTEAEFDDAFTEFKRFAALTRLTGRELGVTSEAVDAVWHRFILFTREYTEFCQRFLGGYLHHHACGDDEAAPDPSLVDAFVTAYREVFGPLPATWTGTPKDLLCSNPHEPSRPCRGGLIGASV